MVLKTEVEGYENFLKFIENFDSNKKLYIVYTGSKLPDGNSWCSDCVQGT